MVARVNNRPGADRVYRLIVRAALGVFRLLDLRFDLRGVEHIPDAGGAVLAASHVSYLDFMLVGLPAHRHGRRLVRFLAKKSVFDAPVSGALMRRMHHIPVDRSAGAAAYRLAVEALGRGELVGVFPEQTISRSFVPRALKSGAARMAQEADVPLLPVVVWGGHRIWTVGRRPRWRRHVPVMIHVGPTLSRIEGESAGELTERLANRLREMVEEALIDYPDRPAGREAWWFPAHLGGGAPSAGTVDAVERAAITRQAAR